MKRYCNLKVGHSFAGVLLLSGMVQAHAQTADVLSVSAGLGVLSSSNIAQSAVASPLSDQITTGTAGLHINKPAGLQRFLVDATFIGNQYASNTNYNYTAQNYSAVMQWSISPDVFGELSSVRTDTLNAGANSVDPTKRNLNTLKTSALTANYGLNGAFRITGGFASTTSTNEAALVGQSNDQNDGFNLGIAYTLASKNSVQFMSSAVHGNNGLPYDSALQQLSFAIVSSPKTTINGSLGYQTVNFSSSSQYNFSGTVGALAVNWAATDRFAINTGWQRVLTAYQTTGSSYIQTDTVSILPTWRVSEKISLGYTAKFGQRNDMGSPSGTLSGRQDRIQDNGLSFVWRPSRKMTVTVSFDDLETISNTLNQSYSVQQAGIAAAYTF